MRKSTSGFTLVELLIVIVVIAILAAISIVSYNGIQSRANLSVAKQDLASIQKSLELYRIDNSAYPHSLTGDAIEVRTELESLDISLSTSSYSTENNANIAYISENDGSSYALLAVPSNNSPIYIMNSSSGNYSEDYPSCPNFPTSSTNNIANCLGFSSNRVIYFVYVASGGGFRIWAS